MTPAETLQAAAAQKLRALATAVESEDHPGLPWHTEGCADEERGNCPCIVGRGWRSYHDEPPTAMFYVADAETPELAAYIAAMHPGVGLALADWLEWQAAALVEGRIAIPDAALAVARQLLGTEDGTG